MDRRPTWLQVAAMVLAGWTLPAAAASVSCTAAFGAPALAAGPLKTIGTGPAVAQVAVVPGHAYLIEVHERDNDALVEVLDSRNEVIARADHPERRTGTRRAVVTAADPPTLVVRLTGNEHAGAAGTAALRVFDLTAPGTRPDCIAIAKALAAADAEYAAGQEIASGHSGSQGRSDARSEFLRAAEEYAAAVSALTAPADRRLRGETALALAGVEYFDLQDWSKAAEWAKTAAEALGTDDPYRHARAESLLAAAWIEIGPTAPAQRPPVQGYGGHASELLVRARATLRRLSRFHLQRGERYDAGLQLASISVTYLYEGRFPECVTASLAASQLFGAIHETLRRAQAWQNQALCLWGLGRLPEALSWFDRARRDIGEQPYPKHYLAVVNNTALANYAVGRFDMSLRLFDRALAFAQEVQSQRDEAQSLYGIGVNYYALGDRARAREFLERSLAIRTVALDGRGRMATLRALANVDAEQGRVENAIALDREALSLAVAPPTVARIRVQLAAHTAATGRLTEARAQLDELISTGKGDRLIQAAALLQRAVLLREMGRPRDALADLAIARPRLHRLGGVLEEFDADLEQARALRLIGRPRAALAAVERALGHSDAVRLQSANPELRAQLQTPLRPAYDLKLELLRERYEWAMAAGRVREADAIAAAAFVTADASRAQSLGDVAAQKYSAAVRRALGSEFHRREELYRELAARQFALDARLDYSGSADPRARHLMSDIAELERQADAVNTEIASRAMPAGTARRAGRRQASLPSLADDTVLVSYWLGSESAYAWVVLPRGIHWTRLPSPKAIADQAVAFHRSLTRLVDVPLERRLRDAEALYEMIIRPLEPWLSSLRQWVFIPDGALDYVPFAALKMPDSTADSFVATRHDIALTPAAWMLDTGGAAVGSHARRALLVVADPVYQPDDPRLAAIKSTSATAQSSARDRPLDPGRGQYERLPFTAQEAVQIAAQFPPQDVDQLIGLDATRDRLLAIDWSAYRFIHIATHGIVDAQVPQLSALVLGSYDRSGRVVDGAVRVADLSLESLAADVAVLSACDTALGKQVPSEGLVGIGSTMLARGARAVVASLWPVSDEIGARLMTEFYRHLLRDSMSPAAALGAAMRSVVSRGAGDPALWAAYQVSVVALVPGPPVRGVADLKRPRATRP